MLASVDPVHIGGALGLAGALVQDAEEVEGGEDEEGEGGALRVVGGVLGGEVGFQAAEPVFDMLRFIESRLTRIKHDVRYGSAQGAYAQDSTDSPLRLLSIMIKCQARQTRRLVRNGQGATADKSGST